MQTLRYCDIFSTQRFQLFDQLTKLAPLSEALLDDPLLRRSG